MALLLWRECRLFHKLFQDGFDGLCHQGVASRRRVQGTAFSAQEVDFLGIVIKRFIDAAVLVQKDFFEIEAGDKRRIHIKGVDLLVNFPILKPFFFGVLGSPYMPVSYVVREDVQQEDAGTRQFFMYFVYDALDALDRVFDGFSGSRIVRSYHQHGNSRLYVVEHTVVDAVQHVAGLVSAHSQVQRLVGSVIFCQTG